MVVRGWTSDLLGGGKADHFLKRNRLISTVEMRVLRETRGGGREWGGGLREWGLGWGRGRGEFCFN